MATLKPPTEESTEREARRYVYDLFSAAAATQAVYTYPAHPLIAQAFEPLGNHHLPLMLDLRSQSWPGWSNKPPNNQLERYVTEEQREALIDYATQSFGLANLVINKGWAGAAKRLKPGLLSTHHLSRAERMLLMEWNDDESHARLMKELPDDYNGEISRHLDQTPTLRSQLETILQHEFEKALPLASFGSHRVMDKIERSAEFGSAAAFDVSLRLLGIVGDLPQDASDSPYPNLLNADGSDFWTKDMPNHERWRLFRRLKVSDFEYVPAKRAWRFLKP